MGQNPFADFVIGPAHTRLSNIVKVYNPPHTDSAKAYAYIECNLAAWVEEAIRIRKRY